MSKRNALLFLKHLTTQPSQRDKLRTLTKPEVLKLANGNGFEFSEREFDDAVWRAEMLLAEQLGEKFDLSFSLWETMWGKYYIDYLAENLGPVLSDSLIARVDGAQ